MAAGSLTMHIYMRTTHLFGVPLLIVLCALGSPGETVLLVTGAFNQYPHNTHTPPLLTHTNTHVTSDTPTPAVVHSLEAVRTAEQLPQALRVAQLCGCPRAAAHCARGSAATARPSASATSCAAASCAATEIRCDTKDSHVRADHVVSSYSLEVSLFAPLGRR